MMWLPFLGAAAGALLDKKKPLRGALLGGAAGAAPGLLSAAPTVPAGMGVAEAAAYKAGAHGLGQAAGQTAAGTMGSKALGLLGHAGNAAQVAGMVNGMYPQEMPPQAQPMQQRPGPDDSGFLAAQTQQRQMDEEQKKMRKMMEQSYIQRLLGGGNGLA